MTQIAPTAVHRRDIFLRISAHLAREVEIQAALAAVAGEIGEVLPFTHVDICLLDTPGWLVSYEVGIKTRWSRKRTRVLNSPVRDLLTGKVEQMLCINAMEDPRQTFPGARCEPIFNHKLRSRVHVVMKVLGQVIGTLNISHSAVGLYDAGSVRLTEHLADVLAPYFHALRALEKAQRDALVRAEVQSREEGLRQGALELTQALEQERQRIGMDLHDQTLADLTRLLRELNGEGAVADRQALAAGLRTCIDDLRQIIDTAVPTLLELFGFAHAVRVHLERAVRSDAVGIDVEDRTDGAVDALDGTMRTALFRITQEAINNASRHSGATRITVAIDRDVDRRLRVVIKDNGRGLSEAGRGRQSGLAHMQTRARLIAARLEIVESGGTSVAVTLPASRQEARP